MRGEGGVYGELGGDLIGGLGDEGLEVGGLHYPGRAADVVDEDCDGEGEERVEGVADGGRGEG